MAHEVDVVGVLRLSTILHRDALNGDEGHDERDLDPHFVQGPTERFLETAHPVDSVPSEPARPGAIQGQSKGNPEVGTKEFVSKVRTDPFVGWLPTHSQ